MAADLTGASLANCDRGRADMNMASLAGADFSGALFGWTGLGDVDLSEARRLDTAFHYQPSSIGVDTLLRSQRQNLAAIFAWYWRS
jgi:hypothetical protein